MPSSPSRRTLTVLIVSLALTLPWCASAAPALREPGGAALVSMGSWDIPARLWGWLAGAWTKEGCTIDPSGLCIRGPVRPAPPAAHTNAGCVIDPSGCAGGSSAKPAPPPPHTDEGCGIDPSGKCSG
ncbi:MAG TPA: hypothetical protein VHR45_22830 [Thermoanaerobaculia bacterium]|nr:hypothetical protein [Thermoanaerobaculia bacterium]